MDSNQTQQLFFNHIKSKIAPHLSFVDEIAELLNISNDSAYRRIRGEKPIALDEAQVLCNTFKVSLDQLLQLKTNTVIFHNDKVDHVSFDFNEYLRFIENNLRLFKMLPNPQMYFYAKDIPPYHYMQFPELSAFKFFFWKRTLIGYPEMAKQKFNGEETDKESLETAKRIIDLYAQVPSTDIWSEESVHITIRQIEFYKHSKVFADKDILLKVYLQLEELLNHLEHQAEAGRKSIYNQPAVSNYALYDAYINECLIGDNTVLVKADDRLITFINHNGLSFMSTQDKDFCDYTDKNMQNIIRKSTKISMVGEKDRSMFFNMLREKIHERTRNIV